VVPERIPRLKPGLGRHCAEAHSRERVCPLGQRRAEPTLQGGNKWARPPGTPAGFTLIEMLVALTLSALVVLLAHRVFAAVTDGAQRLAEARAALDRQANARRLLTALVGDLDIGLPGSSGFNGRPSGVAFSTWIEDSNGWLERRRIGLGVDGGALTVRGLAGGPLVLADSVSQLDVDYLLDYGADAPWVRTWQSPVSAPLAIRIRLSRARCVTGNDICVDTLLMIVGPRG